MSKRKTSSISHDRIFKEFLHRFLPQFVTIFFPDEAKRLDFSTLTFVDKELVINLPEQRLRITDVVAEVRTIEEQPEVIVVHVEVEAGHQQTLPQRMFEYYSLIRLLRQKPVLPLALVLMPRAGGLRWRSYRETLFERELIRFRYGQVGLRDLPSNEYLVRDDPVAAALTVLMKPASKAPSGEELARLKFQALQTIIKASLTEGDREFLVSLVATYLPQSRLPADLGGEGMEALPDIELMWHERIRQEGRQEGRQEMLLSMIAKKFGPLPENFVRRVRAIENPVLLEAISDQLFIANTLDEIMLPVLLDNGTTH